MLVLTRRVNDGLSIGDSIRIVLIEVRGGTVRLGIEAPKDVPIVRGEAKTKRAECVEAGGKDGAVGKDAAKDGPEETGDPQ